jgi:hypothetical protein
MTNFIFPVTGWTSLPEWGVQLFHEGIVSKPTQNQEKLKDSYFYRYFRK